MLWLGDGIAGDDTDGHIDDLARFVAPDTIVTVVEDDPADVNYNVLQDNLSAPPRDARCETAARSESKRSRCRPPSSYDGTRLPASYANFYIANGGVIMPTFDCAADSIARRLDAFHASFPAARRRRPIDRPGLGPRRGPLPNAAAPRPARRLAALRGGEVTVKYRADSIAALG